MKHETLNKNKAEDSESLHPSYCRASDTKLQYTSDEATHNAHRGLTEVANMLWKIAKPMLYVFPIAIIALAIFILLFIGICLS